MNETESKVRDALQLAFHAATIEQYIAVARERLGPNWLTTFESMTPDQIRKDARLFVQALDLEAGTVTEVPIQ